MSKPMYLAEVHDSVVTQWKRAGLITLKSPDRNRATLSFFFQFETETFLTMSVYGEN